MANQMTPAEMRETAKRLREGRFTEQGAWRTSDIEASADALDRLAELIDWVEENRPIRCTWHVEDGDDSGPILRIARGDTTNHENRRG